MIVRKVEDKDLPEIARWFENIRWPYPFAEDLLPSFGLIAESNDEPLACAFLYTTGRSLAFIDWTATNPDITPKLGMMALGEIVKILQDAASSSTPKIRVLCHFVGNDKLASSYERESGFRRKSQTTQMIWVLDEKAKSNQV